MPVALYRAVGTAGKRGSKLRRASEVSLAVPGLDLATKLRVFQRALRSYRLFPGMAGTYDDGKIHSIDYPAGARFIRVTGTDLDKIKRRVYTAAEAQAAE